MCGNKTFYSLDRQYLAHNDTQQNIHFGRLEKTYNYNSRIPTTVIQYK